MTVQEVLRHAAAIPHAEDCVCPIHDMSLGSDTCFDFDGTECTLGELRMKYLEESGVSAPKPYSLALGEQIRTAGSGDSNFEEKWKSRRSAAF